MHKYFIEFLGTLLLIFIIFATNNYLAIGATLAICIFLGGKISGGLFNPAGTIAALYSGRLSRTDFVPYLMAQIAGGLAGYELYKIVKSN